MDLYLDVADRRRFLAFFAEAVERYALRCHAYCEMTTHYHAAITTTEPNLSRAMQWLDGQYASWWNSRHRHRGHAFQARFGAQIVQDSRYLLDVCRYIVLNPVQAGMVRRPEHWPWSSYRGMSGLVPLPSFMYCDKLLELISPDDPEDGANRFQTFVMNTDPQTLSVPGDAIIGDSEFVARFQPYRANASREVPRQEGRPALDAIFKGALTRCARNDAVMTAFRARYLFAEIARYLEVHPSTISKIVSKHRCQSVKKARIQDLTPEEL